MLEESAPPLVGESIVTTKVTPESCLYQRVLPARYPRPMQRIEQRPERLAKTPIRILENFLTGQPMQKSPYEYRGKVEKDIQ